MGFLNEDESSAYIEILGALSLGLSLAVGFFKTFSFPLSLVGSFRKDIHCSTIINVLVGLRRPNIRRQTVLVFCTKFERHTSPR